MAVVTSGSWQKALWPGIDTWFNQGYDEWEEEYAQVFTRRSSGKQFEQTVGQSQLGLATIKEEGDPITYDDTQQTYVNQYTHAVHALGTVITLEAYRDNQYNLDVLSKRPKALAFSMRQTDETVAANVFNNGFDSNFTMGTSSDGVELVNASHPNGPYGAVGSNLDTAADLSETTLEDSCINISLTVDPRGNKIKVMPQCLLIPPQLNFIAGRILGSDLQNDTANNAKNILRSQNTLPDGYKINHYLSDVDAWFVLTNINKKGEGLAYYDAWPLEFGVDNDSDTFNMKVKAYQRYSFGWDDWRGARGNAGA